MKKVLCLVLAMVMVFSAVSVFASEGDIKVDEGLRLSYDGVYFDEFMASKATVSVGLENKGTTATSITFVVVEYSKTGDYKKLVNVKTLSKSIAGSSKETFNIDFTVSDVKNEVSVLAYASSNLGTVPLGSFVLDKFQFIGSETDGTSIYKINSFQEN